MNCEQARPILLDYLLEETPAGERAEIQRHLDGCDTCSQEAARLRQTLGLLVRGAASEEIPQRIRLIAEPVGWWQAFWRNSARLAFAGAGIACLAVGLLGLLRTTVSYRAGDLAVAFGVSPAATTTATTTAVATTAAPATGVSGVSRDEVLRLISDAVAASDARQQGSVARLIQIAAQQAERKRLADLREMSESVRYFQAAQTMMWKEQLQSQQVVSTLMQQVTTAPPRQQ